MLSPVGSVAALSSVARSVVSTAAPPGPKRIISFSSNPGAATVVGPLSSDTVSVSSTIMKGSVVLTMSSPAVASELLRPPPSVLVTAMS